MIRCPKCGRENPDNAANCSNCRINLQFALSNIGQLKEQGIIEDTESARRAALLREQMTAKTAGLLVTTTPIIQGQTILQYLGVVSSVVVLGTGLASELGASVADFLGTRAGAFQDKLGRAREIAMQELKEQAVARGGDAIIGLDLDYMTVADNMLMVSANGTVVKLCTEMRNQSEEK